MKSELSTASLRPAGHLMSLLFVSFAFLVLAASSNAQSGSPIEAPTSNGTPTPTPTPIVFSAQTLADLKRLQEAALRSDYAYRQVAQVPKHTVARVDAIAPA